MAPGCAAERYRQLLYPHGHGYPFWFPEPADNLPPDQKSTGLRVGDLVNLTDDGGWEYLWNIHLPATHPQNALVPPNFVPVALDSTRDIRQLNKCFDKDTAITTTSVKKSEIKADAGVEPGAAGGIAGGTAGFEFTAEGNSGAILTLPRGGVRQNAVKLNVYLQAARTNAIYWYEYINGKLQRGMHNGALYLVTGTDKCSSWGVASFATSTESRGLTLKFMVSGAASSGTSVSNSWSADFGVEHRANVVDSSELSQCVFARGYVISLREGIFASICGMQVKVTSLDGSEGRPPFIGPSRPYSRSAGSERSPSNPHGTRSADANTDADTDTADTDIDVERFPHSQPQKSVAALIGEELLDQNEDARIAIVHDDEWIASTQSSDFLQTRDAHGSPLEDLVRHVATHAHAVVDVYDVCTFDTMNLVDLVSDDPVLKHFKFFAGNVHYVLNAARKARELEDHMDLPQYSPIWLSKIIKVALHQQVIYCDDTALMQDERLWAEQVEVVKQVARTTTRVMPRAEGVSLRFINQTVDNSPNLTLQQISNIMGSTSCALDGNAEINIGTSLRVKILQPLVYSRLYDKTLEQPLLVTLMTGGLPSQEAGTELVHAIKECGDKLQAAGYPRESVKFVIVYFGTASQLLLDILRSNVKDLVATVSFESSDSGRLRSDRGVIHTFAFKGTADSE